jgi:Laminin G domain
LFVQLKTAHPNGLILFSGDVTPGSSFSVDLVAAAGTSSLGSDFMSVELFDGTLRYAFDLGGGARVLQHRLATVSDNRWHVISISRPSVDEHRLQV